MIVFILSLISWSAYGKVILIAGASGDIGLALAKHFANNRDTVICHYATNRDELQKLSDQYPKQIYLIQADFNSPDTLNKFWSSVQKINKNIDVVINSAGIEKEDISLPQIQKTMNINYLSPRVICDYAIENFKKLKKEGIIVNIGSRAAYRGLPKGYYTYADSKAALTKYTQDIARDNAKEKIFAYVVAPGPVEGKMFMGLKEEVRAQCLSSMPTGKPVTIQEVVDMVACLCSGKVPSATGGVFDLMGSSWAH